VTQTSQTAALLQACSPDHTRDPAYLNDDIAAVRALTQAAVNVELFTIPLYMTSMYSIQGMHQITGKGNAFYRNRLWPGGAPEAGPFTGGKAPVKGGIDNDNPVNKASFNGIFSVFIQEMLHLQLAANISTALSKGNYDSRGHLIGPTFTGAALQGEYEEGGQQYPHAWQCYGADLTKIPHIVDLQDMKEDFCFGLNGSGAVGLPESERAGKPLKDVRVELGPLDDNAITLFMAIEADEELIRAGLRDDRIGNYFPAVPFADWSAECGEADLPEFGSIAHMYTCLAEYLNIRYSDGTTLFEAVFNIESAQQDLFNYSNRKGGGGHPCAEFPAMGDLMVTAADPQTAKNQIFNMISGITDQGEGSMLKVPPTRVRKLMAKQAGTMADGHGVERRYQPDARALAADYPSYNDQGEPEQLSADAYARVEGGEHDHFDRFLKVAGSLKKGEITTWDQWHQANPGETPWKAEWLTTADYQPGEHTNIPAPEEVADALNQLRLYSLDGDNARLADGSSRSNFELFSHVAAGSIAGITTVLNRYWDYSNFISDSPEAFPFPSMSGSGDRIAICWAIFGRAPDLSLGEYPRASGAGGDNGHPVNHACQALGFGAADAPDQCATKGIYHTCKGSNQCAGEGGCGFVHDAFKGGSGCGGSVPQQGGGAVSAPGGNQCAGRGGCAVPISESQLFPEQGEMKMQLFQLNKGEHGDYPTLDTMSYEKGDGVYETAWRAYQSTLAGRVLDKDEIGTKDHPAAPKASILRIAFPPST